MPGAGWVGLDPTSGLLTGEGHIPLASTPKFSGAAPISGAIEDCETGIRFWNDGRKSHEDPRVTKPYTDQQWAAIDELGYQQIDQKLRDNDVRLTMGGEPTFIGSTIRTIRSGKPKRLAKRKIGLANDLMERMKKRFSDKPLLHYGQGKWYPGEPIPRWGKTCIARKDGLPMWENQDLFACRRTKSTVIRLMTQRSSLPESRGDYRRRSNQRYQTRLKTRFTSIVGRATASLPMLILKQESFRDSIDRKRLARVLEQRLEDPSWFYPATDVQPQRESSSLDQWPLEHSD